MTQAEIAAAVGCSQATISDIENGKQSRPSYRMVSKLNELLEQRKAESVAERTKTMDDTQGLGGTPDRKTKQQRLSARLS